MKETPWCYMPPEMHFESVRDLCDAFWKFQLSRLQDELNNPQMADYFLPPANKFEKVRNKYGKYILLPTAIDNSYVFRGQTKFFDRCRGIFLDADLQVLVYSIIRCAIEKNLAII